jgi:hypothetical protein
MAGYACCACFVLDAKNASIDPVLSLDAGWLRLYEAVCASTKLGVIFYNRNNARLNETTLDKLLPAGVSAALWRARYFNTRLQCGTLHGALLRGHA